MDNTSTSKYLDFLAEASCKVHICHLSENVRLGYLNWSTWLQPLVWIVLVNITEKFLTGQTHQARILKIFPGRKNKLQSLGGKPQQCWEHMPVPRCLKTSRVHITLAPSRRHACPYYQPQTKVTRFEYAVHWSMCSAAHTCWLGNMLSCLRIEKVT